jgi:hypothetical protein
LSFAAVPLSSFADIKYSITLDKRILKWWSSAEAKNRIRTLIYRILCFRQFYDVIVVYLYHQDSFVFVVLFRSCVYETQIEVFIAFVDQITNFFFSFVEREIFSRFYVTHFLALLCCWWKMKIFHCLKIRVIGLEKSFVFSFFSCVWKNIKCKDMVCVIRCWK